MQHIYHQATPGTVDENRDIEMMIQNKDQESDTAIEEPEDIKEPEM